ncbi:MAG: FAD-dependent oxidoreductase, partial [Pseudomonadales bacterium]|nr:FAD-dependent oxidoreductase [Pseudomonadales bacterium]
MSGHLSHDVLVIGSGAAGLTLALHLANQGEIAVLSKGRLQDGSTWFAQGGIAAVLNDTDSTEAHIADTLVAGAGLCHEDAVRFTVENGRDSIQWLIDVGVDFTREPGGTEFH